MSSTADTAAIRTTVHPLASGLTLALALASCGGEASPSGPTAGSPRTTADAPRTTADSSPSGAPAPAPPAQPAAAGDGRIWLVTSEGGLVALDDSGFAADPARGDARALHAARDGRVTVGTPEALIGFDAWGKPAPAIELSPEIGLHLQRFTMAGAAEAWASHTFGVARYTAGAWTLAEREALSPALRIPGPLAVDRDGHVWLATDLDLFVRAPDAGPDVASGWSEVVLEGMDPALRRFHALDVTADGRATAVTSAAVVRLSPAPEQRQLVPFELPGALLPTAGAVGPAGAAAYAPTGAVVVVDFSGAEPVVRQTAGDDERRAGATALALDGRGRVWVGGDAGLQVYDAELQPHHWPRAAVPELRGDVLAIVAPGAGPATLAGAVAGAAPLP